MKKFAFVLAVVCAMMLSACGNRTAKTEATETVVECVDSTSMMSAVDTLTVEESPVTE